MLLSESKILFGYVITHDSLDVDALLKESFEELEGRNPVPTAKIEDCKRFLFFLKLLSDEISIMRN